MKKEEFFNELKDALELDESINISEDTNLNEFEEYDSLAVLSIIALIDENFGKQLSAQQFADVTTVKSLIDKIGAESFEE